jgi:hypothetical protein
LGLAVTLAHLACAGTSRDVVPETHEVHVANKPPPSPTGYVYVAKRAHGLVALAEARGIDEDIARQATNHLADELEACAIRLEQEEKLANNGAGRVVAQIAGDGTVAGLNVKAAPGGAVAANLLVCVVSPLRLMSFDAAPDAGARGIAIEATWGSARAQTGDR